MFTTIFDFLNTYKLLQNYYAHLKNFAFILLHCIYDNTFFNFKFLGILACDIVKNISHILPFLLRALHLMKSLERKTIFLPTAFYNNYYFNNCGFDPN